MSDTPEQNHQDDIAELVIARLQTLPLDREISIGSEGSFTRDEVIKHIEEGDDIGKKMIEIELNYLRALKEGLLYE